jgi:hypothetical protein
MRTYPQVIKTLWLGLHKIGETLAKIATSSVIVTIPIGPISIGAVCFVLGIAVNRRLSELQKKKKEKKKIEKQETTWRTETS